MKLAAQLPSLVIAAGLVSGCALFHRDGAADAKEPPAADKGPAAAEAPAEPPPRDKAKSGDELELKLAKLWARVDELEEEQFREKEQIRVLEKGLTLGLMPEELKKGGRPGARNGRPPPPLPSPARLATPEAPPVAAKADEDGATAGAKPETPEEQAAKVTAALAKEDEEKYQRMLANAHDHFKAGRYGRAIVEYSEIGKTFGDKIGDGMHVYWIARCWIELKEYNTAYQHLTEFLKAHPTSAWVPRAKLELARVEWQLDHRESAMQLFHDIIETYPNADAAEMAKMELENLPKKL